MSIQDISSPIVFLGSFVKRATATFGLGSNATTLDVDLISPTNPTATDIAFGASGFKSISAKPGKILGLNVGNFNFYGIIQKWDESLSSDNGRTYNVRLVDPRLCFDNIVVSLDGQTSALIQDNYLDCFSYFGNPVSAGQTGNGMRWSKIREFLENTSGINLYGYRFKLNFSSGFYPVTSGTPNWYRVDNGQSTLGSILNNVTTAMNFDYYAYIEPSGFNPTGISTIRVEHIYRRTSSNVSVVSGYLQGLQNSGTLINYRYGEELRSDPTTTVLQGAPRHFWVAPATPVNDLDPDDNWRCYWGRTPDGTAITNENGSASGVVLLDHIVGTGTTNLPTITLPIVSIKKTDVGTYPPQTTLEYTTRTFKGFCPTTNAMRAALHSQEAWESIFYYEDPVRASGCGIYDQRFYTYQEWSGNLTATGGSVINPTGSINIYNCGIHHTLQKFSAEIFERDTVTDVLVSSVYGAVREVAERYYGTSFMCKLQTSTWLQSSTFDSSELYPGIEYEVAGSAWAENNALPDGVPNHPGLIASGSTILKDENGLLRPIFSTPQYVRTSGYSPNKFPYTIDTRKLIPEAYWLEASGTAGAKMVVPVTVEQYEKYPASGIMSFPFVLEGIVQTSGTRYDDQKAFYGFLKAVGYPDSVIQNFKLIETADDNQAFGLVPPRLNYIKANPAAGFGVYIPLRSKTLSYGPFTATGSITGGCRLIVDNTLQPASYGSLGSMNTAGNDILNAAGSTVTVVDSADITVAGLPDRNLGDIVGDSAVISSLSMQFGTDGFTTAYGLRTYVFAPGRVTKLTTDKIARGFNTAVNGQQRIDLDAIRNERIGNVYRPDQITQGNKGKSGANPGNYGGRSLDRPSQSNTAIGHVQADSNQGLYY